MNLDEQLRAALIQEAEMQTVPRPDVDLLISGGRVRRRRRSLGRLGVAAAAAAIVAGGVFTQIDPGTANEPTQPSRPTESPQTPQPLPVDGTSLEPGTAYRMLAGVGASGSTIYADMTVDGSGWTSGNNPVVSEYLEYGGVSAYRPMALAAGTGCTGDAPSLDVGETPQALAQQLARLPRSTVGQPATPVRAFGHDALHLQLRVDTACPANQGYRVAETPRGSHGIN
jgi:hypothetical protein